MNIHNLILSVPGRVCLRFTHVSQVPLQIIIITTTTEVQRKVARLPETTVYTLPSSQSTPSSFMSLKWFHVLIHRPFLLRLDQSCTGDSIGRPHMQIVPANKIRSLSVTALLRKSARIQS